MIDFLWSFASLQKKKTVKTQVYLELTGIIVTCDYK